MRPPESLKLKAILVQSKTHYIQKVISYKQTLPDGFNNRFTSSMSVFIPKLRLNYPKPCVMFYTKNGNGRCLMRTKNPIDLANKLDQICIILRSDLWADIWLHLDGTGNDIINNDFVNDEKYIDLV